MRLPALAIACALGCTPARSGVVPSTLAETSGYTKTGRYAETLQLCSAFARAYAGVACDTLGTSVGGRPIVALRIERATGAPWIYIQGGIHAGEIDGKDAGFWFVRDLLDGKVARGALDHVNVVFVPVLNPDGHERFGPNHRPNQRGPEQMGFRTNAARLNLNRDWIKADAPETRAVLRMFAERDPVVFVDLHATDGAKFEHDISVTMAPLAPRPDALDEVTRELSVAMIARLAALGHLPVDFYPSFVDDENPHSGFAKGEAPPRFGSFYMGARGRIGILVETHSWRTYKERTQSTYHALQALFEDAIANAARWRAAADAADAADAKLAGSEVTLMWQPDGASGEIEFRGYAYEKKLSELTGGVWLVYDEATPEIWRVPLYDKLSPALAVTAPRAGYIVDGGFAPLVAELLDRHAIRYAPAPADRELELGVFRATGKDFAPPYEGRTRASIEGAWATERRRLDAGAIFVPIAQPRARIVLHLFEPSAPDSLAQWGMFNAAFERKEYAEPYVLEEAARAMFAADASLAAEFSEFASSTPAPTTQQKLDWIYRRHPSWDERVDLLPVYRTDTAPR